MHPRHSASFQVSKADQRDPWNSAETGKFYSNVTDHIYDPEISNCVSYGNTWSEGDTLWGERRMSTI